jgi:hypothetical protein
MDRSYGYLSIEVPDTHIERRRGPGEVKEIEKGKAVCPSCIAFKARIVSRDLDQTSRMQTAACRRAKDVSCAAGN